MSLCYVVAVDLGGTQIRAALCDLAGHPLRRSNALTLAHEGPEPVLARIYDAIEAVTQDVMPADVKAIGVASPGPLNHRTGTVRAASNLPGWHDVPLCELIRQRFGIPTVLGNDANLAALAEHTYGAAKGIDDLIYMTLSTGIGGGFISDGHLVVGASGLAAEAGHMILVQDGPLCGCGRRGCLEALASGTAIARYAAEEIRIGRQSSILAAAGGDADRIDARMVAEAAQSGDPLGIETLELAGHYLGLGIVNLLYLLNPRMIVFGGSVAKAGALLFDPMQKSLRRLAQPIYLEGLEIVQAALGEDVVLLGAAALAVSAAPDR